MFLLDRNKTSKPTPDPTNNPDNIVGVLITLDRYNSVNTTEEAQFGINPITPAITGPKKVVLFKKLDKESSPII